MAERQPGQLAGSESLHKKQEIAYGRFLDELNAIRAQGREQEFFNKITNLQEIEKPLNEITDPTIQMALTLVRGNRARLLEFTKFDSIHKDHLPARANTHGGPIETQVSSVGPDGDTQSKFVGEYQATHFDSRAAAHDLIEYLASLAEEEMRSISELPETNHLADHSPVKPEESLVRFEDRPNQDRIRPDNQD